MHACVHVCRYECVCAYMCVCVCVVYVHICFSACECSCLWTPEEGAGCPTAGVTAVISHPTRMLGLKPGFSVRAV